MRKKKIKILHVAQAAGGVDRYIRMLLKYLDKEKFENILVCSQDFNREDYNGLVDSFEQIEMNRAIGVSDLNSIKEVRRLIKKYNPDIVYAHSSKAGAIARVADIGLKNHCVYNPHGWAFNMRCSDKKRAMYTAIEKMAAPFCEKIICISDAVEEYFRTLVQRKKEDKLFELERFMAQVYEENGRCEAAEVAALCLANLYNSGGHRKITPDEYETIKKYLQKFPESMHIRAAFIIASEAIYSPSAEYKRVPDKIINKAKQWSEQYPKKIEFQEAYFGLLFSRLKYAQAQDMRNEQRRVYREMKTVAERANYSEYNESNQLMESVDILHRVFGY